MNPFEIPKYLTIRSNHKLFHLCPTPLTPLKLEIPFRSERQKQVLADVMIFVMLFGFPGFWNFLNFHGWKNGKLRCVPNTILELLPAPQCLRK